MRLQYLLGIFFLFLFSCKTEIIDLNSRSNYEHIYPILPGTTKKLVLRNIKYKNIDIGIDFDDVENNIKVKMTSQNKSYHAKRIPGTNMRLSICNVLTDGSVNLSIGKTGTLKTVWVAIRVEKSPSNFCSPFNPSKNEYIAHLNSDLK